MPITQERLYSDPEIPSLDGSDEHVSDHTVSLTELARIRGNLREDNTYQGREIINRDTGDPEGMVDIRSTGRSEAIVIDSKGDWKPVYDKLFHDMELHFSESIEDGAEHTDAVVLEAIYKAVLEGMEYDLDYVNSYAAELRDQHDGKGGQKVNLGKYLLDRKGVCRHMALACSWLGARASDYGWLRKGGKLTAEVNQRTSDNAAHEWARFTSHDGTVYILDPAQKFFGTLEDSLRQRVAGQDRWEYFRDGEREVYEARLVGDSSVKHAGVVEQATGLDSQERADEKNYAVFQRFEVVSIHGREGNYRIISIREGVARLVEHSEEDDDGNAQQIIQAKLTDLIPLETGGQDNAGQIERPELPVLPDLEDLPPAPPRPETSKQKEIAQRIAEFEAQRADFDAQYQALREKVGEEYAQKLWQVGHYMNEKRNAQNRNDGQGSINYEGYAGEAYRSMPREIAEEWSNYWYLLSKIGQIDTVIKGLRQEYEKNGMITGVPWTPPPRSNFKMAGG